MNPTPASRARRRIVVRGTVQGVGFRPFVYRSAVELALSGFVCNDSAGVLIEAEGERLAVEDLCRRLVEEPPPLAIVSSVDVTAIGPKGGDAFEIVATASVGAPTVPVSVDTAACAACLAEVDDPTDRRFRYPFTNCTDCGPRYSIVIGVPYDRASTTMAGFEMCRACASEYDDPADRRFHAQPNACPDCGPKLRWCTPDGAVVCDGGDALDAAIAALADGRIVAVKGIGGYHLATDATSEAAVAELRRRKARDDKPFAVMVSDVATAQTLCEMSPEAVEALTSPRRPIVIAPRRVDAMVAAGVAPGSTELGVFLPYSPLHHLLLAALGRPLVMTSGNLSDEPIAHDDDDAVSRLGPMVDGLLVHDRPIHIRCDDSVVRARPGRGTQLLRRSRGYAPAPRSLPVAARRPILAVGAELKSTVAVTLGESVVASHHIGDLEHLPNYRSFLQAVDHLCHVYAIEPEIVAHDLHPEYLSTKFAVDLDLDPCVVQHHHAHIASCMAEHGEMGPVLGVAFDGLGYGIDGALWGGEFLVADLRHFERVGHLAPVTMPGGVAAIREPWRMGVAWAGAAGVTDLDDLFPDDRLCAVADLAARGHGPTTTSMGRLFDALAALLGLRSTVTYEGQAAIALEAAARTVPRSEAPVYRLDTSVDERDQLVLDPAPLVVAAVAARASGTPVPLIAAGIHETIGRAAADTGTRLARQHHLATVALSGGVFQNVRLSEIVEERLEAAGFRVLVHRQVPTNDGGISIGQAAVAAARGC
ncbi:MAG: carbamoyltransferase HypF [Actinomycetota bacterium]|nr:carbamoyltransferase HypF [Actinomycetota bacterium]